MVHGFIRPFHISLRSFDKTDPLSIRRLHGKIDVIYMSKFLVFGPVKFICQIFRFMSKFLVFGPIKFILGMAGLP